MTTNPLQEQLNQKTKQLEQYLEPWQRGLLLIALTSLLLFSVYLLTKKEEPEPRELTDTEKKEIEALVEKKILKRMEFFRKLRG